MAPLHRWKLSALAAASAICLGLQPQTASALALGRLTVQSALGEPLRAEIEVPQISSTEADTLRAMLGSAEQFRSQGLEFPSTLSGLQIQLQRRVGGQTILQLRTERAITEPFLDLVLDAQWQNGRLIRSYTLLLDPPAERRPASLVRLAPQVSAPTAAAAPAPSKPSGKPAISASPVTAAPRTSAELTSTAATAPTETVVVQPGETATQIANRHRPAEVSLDQMLLALLQGNPRAFIQRDIHRIKAGATLKLPDAATAKATPPEQARQALLTHSADFNTYRRELAAIAPSAEVAPAGRSAAGAIQAQVEEKKAAPPSPDKLLLSRSGIDGTGTGTAEAQLAREKQAQEAQARVETLNQNIAALNQAQGSASSPPAPGTAEGSAPAPAGEAPAAAAPSAAPAAPETPSPTPPGVAPPPGVSATAPDADAAPWSRNPLIPFAAGSLSALLLSYGVFRFLQARQTRAQSSNSFLQQASELSATATPTGVAAATPAPAPTPEPTPEPVAAPQPVPTPVPTPLAPSESVVERTPSNDNVDPVAEADVYLAYGREQQAEEILNEALLRTPSRTAIHAKLAEIHAARHDRVALQRLQAEVLRLTNGQGPDWERVVALVQSLEPGASKEASPPAEVPPPPPPAVTPTTAQEAGDLSPMEFDFSLNSAPLPSQTPRNGVTTASATEPAADEDALNTQPSAPPQSLLTRMELPSLDLVPPAAPAPAIVEPATVEPVVAAPMLAEPPRPLREPETVASPPEDMALEFVPQDLPVAPPSPSATPASASALSPAHAAGAPLELDLQGLTLELDSLDTAPPPPAAETQAEATPPSPPAVPEPHLQAAAPADRLATKLALAAEFKAIGDIEGTRSLLQEVVAEASGDLQARAQQMLAELG